MSKMKTTINLEYKTFNQADKVRKMMGIDTFSNFIEFILNKHCNNPKELAKDKIREHQKKMMFYNDIVQAIEEQESIIVEVKETGQPERRSERQW